MKKQRKHYTPEEKVAILRRHLVEGYVEHYNNFRLNSAIGYIMATICSERTAARLPGYDQGMNEYGAIRKSAKKMLTSVKPGRILYLVR